MKSALPQTWILAVQNYSQMISALARRCAWEFLRYDVTDDYAFRPIFHAACSHSDPLLKQSLSRIPNTLPPQARLVGVLKLGRVGYFLRPTCEVGAGSLPRQADTKLVFIASGELERQRTKMQYISLLRQMSHSSSCVLEERCPGHDGSS